MLFAKLQFQISEIPWNNVRNCIYLRKDKTWQFNWQNVIRRYKCKCTCICISLVKNDYKDKERIICSKCRSCRKWLLCWSRGYTILWLHVMYILMYNLMYTYIHFSVNVYSALYNIPLFYLIPWCWNFVRTHSFRIFLGESTETLQCFSCVHFHKISIPRS